MEFLILLAVGLLLVIDAFLLFASPTPVMWILFGVALIVMGIVSRRFLIGEVGKERLLKRGD